MGNEESDCKNFVYKVQKTGGGPTDPRANRAPSSAIALRQSKPQDTFGGLSIFEQTIDYHEVTCKFCGMTKFTGSRYFCCVCRVNLCGSCYEKELSDDKHALNHLTVYIPMALTKFGESRLADLTAAVTKRTSLFVEEQKIQTEDCSKCSSRMGIRFKCEACKDLILCLSCFRKESHDVTHRFVVFISPILKGFDLSMFECISTSKKKGCFGSVKKVKSKISGEVFALKLIEADFKSDWGKEQVKSFENEKRAYFQLRSSNIIACFGFKRERVSESRSNLYLLLQWCERGSLGDLIENEKEYQRISLRRRTGIVKTLISGLRLIHRKGFIHKDIKPDNILLDRYLEVKIGDMGITVEHVENKAMYSLAHQEYAAPELKIESGSKAHYDNKVDIYALGLVINMVFTSTKHTFKKHLNKLLVEFPKVTSYFSDVVSDCVEYNPTLRPSAQRLEEYFEGFDRFFWESVLRKYEQKSYECFPIEEKNEIFRSVYEQFIALHPFQTP